MTKSQRKRERAALLAERERERREARWNPELPEEERLRFHETVEAYLSAYESLSKPSARLERSHEPVGRSRAGGPVIWPDARPWPTASNGNPLTAVLELFVDELPVVPAALVGVQRMQVFLELTEAKPPPARGYFTQRSYPLGGAHRVVTHREANGGPRFEGVSDDHVVSLVARLVPTYPTGEAVRHLPKDLAAAFRRLPSSGALFGDRIRSEPFPHVGGWPHALGDGDGLGDGDEIGDFVMQLDGELLGVDLGPDGQLYFGIDEGEWKMSRVVG